MASSIALYDQDYYAWSRQQASLLRSGMVSEADLENIAEEIESMGRSEKRELASRLTVLLLHLLKWQFQPGMRGKSWRLSIKGQRADIEAVLRDNPSLKSELKGTIAEAYHRSLIDAEKETGLDGETFPAVCPYGFADMMREDFWPGAPA